MGFDPQLCSSGYYPTSFMKMLRSSLSLCLSTYLYLCFLCILVPTCQMARLTSVSAPANSRYPVSENQMNHFHSTDAPVTDRPRRLGISARMAQRLTARSGELRLHSAQDGQHLVELAASKISMIYLHKYLQQTILQ